MLLLTLSSTDLSFIDLFTKTSLWNSNGSDEPNRTCGRWLQSANHETQSATVCCEDQEAWLMQKNRKCLAQHVLQSGETRISPERESNSASGRGYRTNLCCEKVLLRTWPAPAPSRRSWVKLNTPFLDRGQGSPPSRSDLSKTPNLCSENPQAMLACPEREEPGAARLQRRDDTEPAGDI